MAGQQGGGGDGKGLDEGAILVILFVTIAVAWLLWHFAKAVLIYPSFYCALGQYYLLNSAGLLNNTGIQAYHYVHNVLNASSYREPYHSAFAVSHVTWEQFTYIQQDIGHRFFLVWCLILSVLTCVIIFKMKGQGFRRIFTLTGEGFETVIRFAGIVVGNKSIQRFLTAKYKFFLFRWIAQLLITITGLKFLTKTSKEWRPNGVSFAHYQAKEWKVFSIGANFNPDKNDEIESPQLRPIDWLKKHNVRLTKKEGLDTEHVQQLLSSQLGASWQGLDKAPLHVQAIAILAALNLLNGDAKRHKYKKKVHVLRDALADAYEMPLNKRNERVAQLLQPYLEDKLIVGGIKKVMDKYAYVNTACLAVYAWGGPMVEWGGGRTGVLSSSMLRWMKRIDRVLWYSLNNVGRRKFHVEAAGVVNHFFAERIWGAPLDEPHVDEAIEGVNLYLATRYIDDMDTHYKVVNDFDDIN